MYSPRLCLYCFCNLNIMNHRAVASAVLYWHGLSPFPERCLYVFLIFMFSLFLILYA
ncbi:hypothetical protein HMPREF0208_05018 [Citrobacter koseri]|nr:hypothetical protein HMPREF3207_02586 [Citrobacter koseri]KXB38806.1 hypothetical protein HMPREF0208_05018 [Citrobacter koseri]